MNKTPKLAKKPVLPASRMTPSIRQALGRLCGKMCQVGYETFDIERVEGLIDELQRRNVHGIDAFLRRLQERVNDRQDYLDISKEGRFAVILSRNGFSQIHIEYSRQGPDLKANYNRQTVYFEVTRKRPKEDEWAESSDFDAVESDRPENIISKIQEKLRQFSDEQRNVVVYWSSTISVMPLELQEAFTYIQQEIDTDSQRYQKLSGILFTDEGIDLPTLKQFYLFKNDKASKPLGIRLARKLESLHEQGPKKLRTLEAVDDNIHSEPLKSPNELGNHGG